MMRQFIPGRLAGVLIFLVSLWASAGIVAQTKPLPPNEKLPTVVIETSMGNMKLELYPDQAPLTVANFLAYVDAGYYNGTIFHRVIPYFMIQGGGFDETMSRKETRPPVVIESDNGLLNQRGTVAMARTSDVNSATSQFFINVEDNRQLNRSARDAGYTVFGKLIDNMPVADSISEVKTGMVSGMSDVPLEKIVIQRIYRD